ncbi:MAG TPA: nucleotidyl transferase AbiEii/AbiGii toxin family protein [Gammaproteobacteria bacterium]|nr:nucleotidyl transferase AbiEii/AbiGii toxin family protein [Gammaproteobacteria bacterium]
MSVAIVQQKLLSYKCQTVEEQENALKEIAQEIALMALSRSGFFRIAAFQGGTCLRILYGLERFSEDLDFVLVTPDANFKWGPYIKTMAEEFQAYGYTLEITDKSTVDKIAKNAFIKADSKGGLLIIKDLRTNRAKLQIKLEIDVNPPAGSIEELKFLDFPLPYSIRTQDLPSLFASKSYALLCRAYIKGRDWFDFLWYVSRKVNINFNLLKNAINQAGPWKNNNISVDKAWFLQELKNKIISMDWEDAKKDVARFLRPRELAALEVWSSAFFISRVDILEKYL